MRVFLPRMNGQDQKLLDGIRITTDANLAGQVEGFETMRELLRARRRELRASVDSSESSVTRTLARGACDEIDRLLDEVEALIESVLAKRSA